MTEPPLMQPMPDRRFRFACLKALPCFTRCCADLNLVLTPYDVLRLKNRLKLSSGAFLESYTTSYVDAAYRVPVVKLKMNDDEKRRCPFVRPEGCVVYEDRPGACRLYPLGRAASKMYGKHTVGEYYFIVKESHCLGLNEEQEWPLQGWLTDQGLDEYNTINDVYMDLITARSAKIIKTLGERQLQMFYMASYSLDDFKRFVFETTFLDKLDIAPEVLKRIKTDDIELMAFACQWLKFSLFGEKTFQIRRHIRAEGL